jgi:uncharacterized alkaline shock family protein YloU
MAINNKVIIDNNGETVCNRSILLSIISLATKEISGVASMDNRLLSKVRRLFSHNYFEGVSIKYKDNSIIIDIYFNIFYNYNVSEIAYKVQENVRNEIKDMVNVKIDAINIHIVGVEFENKEENVVI